MVLRLTVAERSMVDPVTRLEDVIRIVEIPARGTDYGGGTIITFSRHVLAEYLVLADSAIAPMFDITRYRPRNFGGWSERHDVQYRNDPASTTDLEGELGIKIMNH